MFVATAKRGSMPNWSMTGTVISEVLPVTKLIMLVKKNIATKASSSKGSGVKVFLFGNTSFLSFSLEVAQSSQLYYHIDLLAHFEVHFVQYIRG